MFRTFLLLFYGVCIPSIIQCELTNLNDFLNLFKQNLSNVYPVGFLSQANFDVVKRYLPGNIDAQFFKDKKAMLAAIDNETIVAGVTTGQLAEDLEPIYHVFSSLIVSPQAILLAPDYNSKSTPYGLQNTSSDDLFDALNAAITNVQREDVDETLLASNNRTDLVRIYTCRQDTSLPVIKRNDTTGYLRDILDAKKIIIGGYGPFDWGVHDGNYKVNSPTGFYPQLLDAIVKKLGGLKGPDDLVYSEGLTFERKYYPTTTALFRALLNGDVHATDVYILIDAPYNGTGEICSNDSSCRARELCTNGICTHPLRPRSLHFRSTCTTASRDTKFITKKPSVVIKTNQADTTPRQTPKTRWIGFVLIFVVLFGMVFLALLILLRRKKNYRVEHTVHGGFGKFARLQEEAELPTESMDAFDDHIVQSPRDNTNPAT